MRIFLKNVLVVDKNSGGFKGALGTSPLDQKFFIFMQFSKENWPNRLLELLIPIWEIIDLLLENNVYVPTK